MKKYRAILIGCLASCLFISQLALAADGQFYMTAKFAPLGGSSAQGKGPFAVYVRWDLIEGEIPNDVVSLRLTRGATEIFTVPVNVVLSVSAIQQLYAGASEQQRLLKTITLLKDYALSKKPNYGQPGGVDDLLPAQDFNASNFAAEISRLLAEDPAWAHIASRQNFDIARARNRAYLDLNPGTNPTYYLTAIDAQGVEAQIGQVRVDTNKNDNQLLAVANFEQVAKTSCDAAASMADHQTVILNWAFANNNVTDKAASSIQLAGYRLYRSKTDFTGPTPPVRDIASEAASSNHDQRGNSQIAGLEIVEKFLIMSESSGDGLDNAAYTEMPSQIEAAGLKGGDRRAYYIVPVDYAGHFGKTSVATVIIPDRTPIVLPWNVAFKQVSDTNAEAKLIWDASALENYQAVYGGTRTFCNVGSSEAASGLISFAYSDESCDEPNYIRLGVADSDYTVYRFDNFEDASTFTDNDFDGVDDSAELDSEVCNTNLPVDPSNRDNYRKVTGSFSTVLLSNGRSKVVFQDDFLSLPENQSKVYWYRIASKAGENVSELTAPTRAVYFDTTAPEKPIAVSIVRGNCCDITKDTSAGESWKFTDTINEADKVSLAFKNDSGSQSAFVNLRDFGNSNSFVCDDKGSPIEAFIGKESDRPAPRQRVLSYGDICSANIPNEMNLCKTEGWLLQKRSCDIALVDGMTVDGQVEHQITFPLGTCGSYSQSIGSSSSRTQTSCGTDTPGVLVVVVDAGVCGVATSEDANGNTSPPLQLPCSQAAATAVPGPPQPIYLNANQADASFSWRLPLEPVAVTLVELTSDVNEQKSVASDKQIFSIPNAGFSPGRVFEKTTAIHNLLSSRDQWCVRFKAVAPARSQKLQAVSSDWSQPICKTRRLNSVVESDYLPWPKIDNVRMISDRFTAHTIDSYFNSASTFKPEKTPIIIPFFRPFSGSLGRLLDEIDRKLCDVTGSFNDGTILYLADEVTCKKHSIVERLQGVLTSEVGLSFLVYRQAKSKDGELGKWVQVSPLIDSIFWEQIRDGNQVSWKLNDPYFNLIRESAQSGVNWGFSYIDRYPYIAGYQYRYQLVSFDQQHAINKIHQTNWVQTDIALQEQQGEAQ